MPSYSCHAQNLRFLAAEGNGKERIKIRHFQKLTPAYGRLKASASGPGSNMKDDLLMRAARSKRGSGRKPLPLCGLNFSGEI
jgi:hypothetical protein